MSLQYWYLPTEVDMSLLDRLALEYVESGKNPDSMYAYMSPDVAQKINEMFMAITRYSSATPTPTISSMMRMQTSAGLLDFKVCPKMRCFLMVGNESDYNYLTNNGIPLEFLSDQAHRELYEAIETTVLADDTTN